MRLFSIDWLCSRCSRYHFPIFPPFLFYHLPRLASLPCSFLSLPFTSVCISTTFLPSFSLHFPFSILSFPLVALTCLFPSLYQNAPLFDNTTESHIQRQKRNWSPFSVVASTSTRPHLALQMCISSIYSRARGSFNDGAQQAARGTVVFLSGPVRFLHTPTWQALPTSAPAQTHKPATAEPRSFPFFSFSTLPASFLIIVGRSNNPRFTYPHAFYDFLSPFSRFYSHCITLTNYKLIKTSNNLSLQKRISFFVFLIFGEHGLLQ